MTRPLDRLVFDSEVARAGRFSCRVSDSRFRDSGPVDNYLVVFPRTSVWIRHAGSREFVADPTVATIYNKGQEYTRGELHHEGDRCEWFAVSRDIAVDIAGAVDPSACDRADRPFVKELAPVSSALYLKQRIFFSRLERGLVDRLEAEETIIGLVSAVITGSGNTAAANRKSRSAEAHRDLVQRARAELLRSIADHASVSVLAARLGVSAFHLCRVFREQTGMGLHSYRLEVRMRTALERLAQPGADISRVAFDLGFSSHSHFTEVLGRRSGLTPTQIRQSLIH
ncbi:MAG: helix-turn-helix domain-containing protein [Gemmatimonadaceae bacterium]